MRESVLSSEYFSVGKQERTTSKDRQIEKDSQHSGQREEMVWMLRFLRNSLNEHYSHFSMTENKSQHVNGKGERDGKTLH